MTDRILVFGEDDNDREVLREIIVALCPDAIGRIEKRRKPLLLAKGAQPSALRSRASKLVATVRADEAASKKRAWVFVHEDADGLPPEDELRSKNLREAASAEGLEISAVVPAWETEAWFFLFPSAVAAAFPSWKGLPKAPRRVDMISNAKEEFRRATSPKSGHRRYSESDGPRIARFVRQLGLANQPIGSARAYDRFRDEVARCAASLSGTVVAPSPRAKGKGKRH